MKENNTEYVLSLSYGKDSMASIHVIKDILHLPLTRIIHAEVWATDTIPADLPPMVDFKAKADKIIKERWGIDVEHVCAMKKPGSTYGVFGSAEGGENAYHTILYSEQDCQKGGLSELSEDSQCKAKGGADILNTIVQPKLTYENIFYRPIKSSRSKIVHAERERERERENRMGNRVESILHIGTQKIGSTDSPDDSREIGATANSKPPLDGRKNDARDINVVQYIGIAADEPKRIAKHKDKPNTILPLVEAGWTEPMCRKWCEENDLLAPTYTTSLRGGCWFCHNQGVEQLRLLRHNYPDLWEILMRWDLDSPVTFHADGHTVHDFDRRFQLEDDGLIKPTDPFHWAMLDGNIELKIDFGEPK